MSDELMNENAQVDEVVEQESPIQEAVETHNQIESFHATLPEDLREESSLKDIKSVEDLAKSFVNAQQMIGNSVRIPTEQAGEETWESFYSKLNDVPGLVRIPTDPNADPEALKAVFDKLGAPQSADGYSIELDPSIEPLVSDEVNAFKEVASKAHLTKAQAEELASWRLDVAKQQYDQMMADMNQANEVLKQKWGASYEERIKGAGAAVRHFRNTYGDSFQSIIDSPLGNHPAVLEMMSMVGAQLGEQGIIESSSSPNRYGKTPEEAARELQDFWRNTDKVAIYRDISHKDHKKVKAEVDSLYKIKQGLSGSE